MKASAVMIDRVCRGVGSTDEGIAVAQLINDLEESVRAYEQAAGETVQLLAALQPWQAHGGAISRSAVAVTLKLAQVPE